MKRNGENDGGIFLSFIKTILFFVVSGIILLVISSVIAYNTKDPTAIIKPLGLSSLYLSAMICGISASRVSGGSIVAGVISGITASILILTLSLIPMGGEAVDFLTTLLFAVMIIPSSVLGAIIGKPRQKSARKHHAKNQKNETIIYSRKAVTQGLP